jgi:predicted transcriptional regulator
MAKKNNAHLSKHRPMRLGVPLSKAESAEVKKLAKHLDRSRADAIRQAVSHMLSQIENDGLTLTSD